MDGSFPDFFSGVNCDLLQCGGDAVVFDYFDVSMECESFTNQDWLGPLLSSHCISHTSLIKSMQAPHAALQVMMPC